MHRFALLALLIFHSTLPISSITGQETVVDWKPVDGVLLSQWAQEVSSKNVHPEYPRPQMVRADWHNLNGLWDYAIRPKAEGQPSTYDGKILVPFAVESALSGVGKPVGAKNTLWYRTAFDMPADWRGRRLLLNFGAVDWEATIWVNGRRAGTHRGGYDGFAIDITDELTTIPRQEIVVSAWDPADEGTQPRGKQVTNPGGIWYTSVSGIWQTVWLEPVGQRHIESIKINTDIDSKRISVQANISNPADGAGIEVILLDAGKRAGSASATGNRVELHIENPKLWSPASPFLYDLQISLKDIAGKTVDTIHSYAGMRKISLGQDESHQVKLFLNNEELFHFGPLDQGWWPDGLYTAPTDAALKYDVEVTRKLGYNMARKHVKVEPARWYYWCDKLGLMVWQDMPSGDKYIDPNEADMERSPESAEQFKLELKRMIDQFGNHPSIVAWVPFNEGWGQFETQKVAGLIRQQDPTRLISNASGWADRGAGDMVDIHAYPGPAMPDLSAVRAPVLGEFGGLGLPVRGHTWQSEDNWGYRQYESALDLTAAYRELIRDLYGLRARGLAAAVYTQTTDVEVEVNGLMTYDRAVVKMNAQEVARINAGFLPPIISSENDIFLDSGSVHIFNVGQPGEMRYTLDGAEPTFASPVYAQPITVNRSATIKARTFWSANQASEISEYKIRRVELQPSFNVPDALAGLVYSYFEKAGRTWDKLPNFRLLTPVASGVAERIDLTTALRDELFGIQFEGYINVPYDGIYTFYAESDDGSRIFIDDRLIVDNDGNHGMVEKEGSVALAAGYHPFRVGFFQGVGGKALRVSVKGPGLPEQEVSRKLIAHRAVNGNR